MQGRCMSTNTTPGVIDVSAPEERFELGEIPVPIGDRILVMRDEVVTESEGGIIIPDVAGVKPKQGTVLAVGIGRRVEMTGELIPMEIKVGDHVRFSSYAGTDLNGTEKECGYVVMREDDVLCVDQQKES